MHIEHDHVQSNGIKLHTAAAGPSDGPLVLMLHGFPDCWMVWEYHIKRLAEQGYRVWAPDQRGYNLSDKPARTEDYLLDVLVEDVVGLIEAAGRKQAHVVGHDWGGAVAWRLAAKYPDRVSRLVAVNIPPIQVFLKYIQSNPLQLLKSWYIGLIQIPWLPEKLGGMKEWEVFRGMLVRSGHQELERRAVFEAYRQAWNEPEAFASMLKWYRANVRGPALPYEEARVAVPTLMIWGERDVALSKGLIEPSLEVCDHAELLRFAEASHWVQLNCREEVGEALERFLGKIR